MRRENERYTTNWARYITEGRLEELAEILGYGPSGCEHCNYGIVSEPDMKRIPVPLWLCRSIAASQGAVIFCECRAGQSQRALFERYLKRIPAHFLNANSKATMVNRQNDGGYAWASGSAPLDYISADTVRVVLDAIEAAPPIHLERAGV